MKNLKEEVLDVISKVVDIEKKELDSYIEVPKDQSMGDFAFPCFRLAKVLRKAPTIIAQDIKEKINIEGTIIEKVEVVGGYLNFYINNKELTKIVLEEINDKKEKYGSSKLGEGKNVVIDYSSPNIAKQFHIGHLRSTVIGGALYNMYKFIGYNTIGINHLGDWGTQFGKLIEACKLWENEYDIESNPIETLTNMYVRISKLSKEDESVLERCRDNFKKLEDGDPYCVEKWKKLRELSLREFQKVYDQLGSHFDSLNGEAFYCDKMPEVIDKLEKSGKLVESQGAKIIDLEEYGMAPCIIQKSNGSTTYATRDLAAILYRARTYDFDKALYVTSYEQILHFKQVFKVAELLGLDKKYTDNLVHVPFGMVLLPTGKMSTREGNVIKLEDLLNESVLRAKKIIEEKNPNLENKDDVAKKVGIGAVIFNDLSTNRIKDEIFDWDTLLNFQGETGPYVQYIFVRTKSVLENAGYIPKYKDIDIEKIQDVASLNVIKLLYSFADVIENATLKNEPSILARYLIDVAKSFSSFYNENKILVDDKALQNARLYVTYSVNIVLKTGANLLGIQMPDKM